MDPRATDDFGPNSPRTRRESNQISADIAMLFATHETHRTMPSPSPERLSRSSGVLLHPTSFPGQFGVGDLGPASVDFLDFLAESGQRWWQILPIVPTGSGNSPYQSYSTFAGNPLLISPERMAEAGWLSPDDWADLPAFPEGRVDYDAAIPAKDRLLRRAFANLGGEGPAGLPAFVAANADWLEDYALYMALKEHHGGAAWYDWEPGLALRDPGTLADWQGKLDASVRYHRFVQFAFASQWEALREECRSRGVLILGDLPIFVALDSADVWACPHLFCLDERGRPTVVAGVPPDAFAPETGQLWGNPLYHWPAHAEDDYAWWVARIRAQLNKVDMVRLDHFRGLEAYWEVPADAETAAAGRWVAGPGVAFFEAVRDALGELPLVAEDLGVITEGVTALRDRFHLPGMRVLQFGLEGTPGTEFHLPYSFVPHCFAYTGTHDNDTTVGWFRRQPSGDPDTGSDHEARRAFARKVVGSSGDGVHWDVIRAALGSVADTVIVPMQDLLGLGEEARMNVPGRATGNWSWRLREGEVTPEVRSLLAELTAVTGRRNGSRPDRIARGAALHPGSPPSRDAEKG